MGGEDLLPWLGSWPGAVALRASPMLYIFVNAAHILSVGLLVGTVLPLDLRLTGAFPHVPLGVVGPFLSRIAATGLVFAIATGVCLFSVQPQNYISNEAFLIKIALLATAIANVGAFYLSGAWRVAISGSPPDIAARASAILSLILWLGTLLAGRWIGFS